MKTPIIVIGAGGAGIIAAWKAALSGAPVMLLEKNARPGVKILISGGGKCNITHTGTIEEVLNAFCAGEKRFLKPSMHRFSNADILELLRNEAISTYARPNGRVFPEHGTARDVMRAFSSVLEKAGVRISLQSRVERIVRENNSIRGVVVNSEEVPTSHLIIATGGKSYPKTGTTGDGFAWAKELGHTLVPLRAALAPMVVTPTLPREWQGIALRGCRLFAVGAGRRIASWDDDVLFTHEGVSGPAALEVSRSVAAALESHEVELFIDFFPGKEFDTLDDDLNAYVQSQRQKTIATLLDAWMPNRLVEWFLVRIGVSALTRGIVLSRDDRRAIAHALKEWSLGTVAEVPLERGEVTAGGVTLREVDPRTMRSRIVRGLYLCGEVLDIAGPIGGYNLQAAFSTGFVAGESAAASWHAEGDETKDD